MNSVNYGPDIGQANQSANRIFSIIDSPSEINPLLERENPSSIKGLEQRHVTRSKGEIEFKNVWFKYPSRKEQWVLSGFNLKIHPNESIALVGESGCGKSTLVQLLLRFYDVSFGQITLDGQNIKDYPLGDLRRQMGLVMQEPILFNYSLYENILYGQANASN
mmetsp:Transcript_36972/g.35679  ORF Transcript_36972/g.35679 Transcript_36972/m.35679 type:complete len:163 (+) Transcript_36972:744-1232(+)